MKDIKKRVAEIIEKAIDDAAAGSETYEEVRRKLIADTDIYPGSVGCQLVENYVIKRALSQKIER